MRVAEFLSAGHGVCADDRGPPLDGRTDVLGDAAVLDHAGFVPLARGIGAGHPVDVPQLVACRHRTSLCQQ
jgi:hypothetical protein